MKKPLKYVLYIWAALTFGLLLLSFINVRNSGEEVRFICWAYPLGAFIWEDLLIFSLFNTIASVLILFIDDSRYIFVFGLCFWLIRSLGETFYWFLQQFIQPSTYPHNYYDWQNDGLIRRIMGDISDQKYFVIFQITWQVVSVFCIVGFIYLFKNWKKIGKKLNG